MHDVKSLGKKADIDLSALDTNAFLRFEGTTVNPKKRSLTLYTAYLAFDSLPHRFQKQTQPTSILKQSHTHDRMKCRVARKKSGRGSGPRG